MTDNGKLLSALKDEVCAECFGKIFREINRGYLETRIALEEKRKELLSCGAGYQRVTLDEAVAQRVGILAELQWLRAELSAALARPPV